MRSRRVVVASGHVVGAPSAMPGAAIAVAPSQPPHEAIMSCSSNHSALLVGLTLLATAAAGACSDDLESLGPTGNRPPSVPSPQVLTDEDIAVEIRLLDGATDVDGDALTVTHVAGPSDQGIELLPGGILRVTPKHDFNGLIQIEFDVSDGSHRVTNIANVTVRPVNDPPVAMDSSLQFPRVTMLVLAANDIEGDPLRFAIAKRPEHGSFKGDPPIFSYIADVGYVGRDSFTYQVSDGRASSAPATVELDITGGTPPHAFSSFASSPEDMAFDLVLQASDDYDDPLTYTIVTPPANGTLSGTAPHLRYTPNANFNGNDTLEFSVSDGVATSNTATFTIFVMPINDPPVANPQSLQTNEDTPLTITLTGSDPDGGTPVFSVKDAPAHGTLVPSGSTRLIYTPAANYHGPDSFTFTATDFIATSPPATVTIDVASVEDPPVAASFHTPLNEDTSATVTLQGSDGDGDPISYQITSNPGHGTLTGTPPALTYTPEPNFHGTDSFTYTVSSNGVTSPPGTVTLDVASVNDPPIAVDGSASTDEDTPVAIPLQASDVDGQTLTFTVVTPPADGTVSITGATATYTPAPNASGTRSFVFRASDGSLGATATITIAIRARNDPPTTVDDFAMTDPATPITLDVVANDFDVEGETVTLDAAAKPAHGTAEVVDGELRYTPDAGFLDTELVTYTAVDSHGAASTGTAHVGVGVFPPGVPAESFGTVTTSFSTASTEFAPTASADGRYIAFTSLFALVPDDTNARTDVYRFDRRTHTVLRVSVSSTGAEGNSSSQRPQLSADGRYVVFESLANNLVAGDTNGALDVFRHDCVTGETVRVSVATGGGQATGASRTATVSSDGNLVAFASTAFDLVPDDANGVADVFVRDLAAGTTARISLSITGSDADLAAGEPAISGDGRFVAFSSVATNLVPGDSNGVSDIFVRDRVAGTTARISVSSTGSEANAASTGPSISQDGRVISFLSTATNLVVGPATSVAQLYTHDVVAQTTLRPVVATQAVIWGRLSSDARYVTEFGGSGVVIRNRIAGTGVTLSTNLTLFWPVLSGNGRYVILLDAQPTSGTINVRPNPV